MAMKIFLSQSESFENVSKFTEKNTTNSNQFHDEIKCIVSCYPFKKPVIIPYTFKILISELYKTVLLPLTLYQGETFPLTLREEHNLQVSEN